MERSIKCYASVISLDPILFIIYINNIANNIIRSSTAVTESDRKFRDFATGRETRNNKKREEREEIYLILLNLR